MSNYVKPQSPLYNEHNDTYVYPLTTVDQIIMPDGSRMDPDNLGGNKIELNYSVVGGTTQPSNPTENMIWVNTDQKNTNYIFSKNEPQQFKEGMVWIQTCNKSNICFNRLKVNNIEVDEVHILYAQQYINNIWTKKMLLFIKIIFGIRLFLIYTMQEMNVLV